MGSYISCISSASPTTTTRDMSVIRNKNLPFIWITGPPNSGKKTIARLLKNKYEFEYISITDLLRQEASKETKNALIIKRYLNQNRKVPDAIVIDLLKGALLASSNDKGFLITNFPKTIKQTEIFTREIGNVNFVYYLYTGFPLLIDRAQRKSTVPLDNDVIRRNIALTTREIKASLAKFALKIESINTNGLPEETFPKVETALIRRINIARPIITERDYIQVQQIQCNEQSSGIESVNALSSQEETHINTAKDQSEIEEAVHVIVEIEKQEVENEMVDNQTKGNKTQERDGKEGESKILVSSTVKDGDKNEKEEYTNNEEREIKLTELNQEVLTKEANIISLTNEN